MRLYRELDLSAPSKKTVDLSYERERMEILQQLNSRPRSSYLNKKLSAEGFDATATFHLGRATSALTATTPQVIRPLKHHGKVARMRKRFTQRPVSPTEIAIERDRGTLATILKPVTNIEQADYDVITQTRERRSQRLKEEEQRKKDEWAESQAYKKGMGGGTVTGDESNTLRKSMSLPDGIASSSAFMDTTVVGVVPLVPPILSPPNKQSMTKLEKQKYMNHIQYKYEQSKRMIHEEIEPYVKKHLEEVIESSKRQKKYLTDDQLPQKRSISISSHIAGLNKGDEKTSYSDGLKIPKSLVTKLVAHDNRLSTSDEKIQNTTLTLKRLGMKSTVEDMNAMIAPPTRHLPTLNTTNISLSPKTKYPDEAIFEDDQHSEQVALNSTSIGDDQRDHRRSGVKTAGEAAGSMTSTLKSRLYAITNNHSPPKAPKYVPTIHHDTKFHENSYKVNPHTKWTHEEKERFRVLFHELPLPSSYSTSNRQFNPITHNQIINANQVELWKLYMANFSERFRTFHPHRTEKEISGKLQEMISRKQFKFHGEEEYWRHIQGQGQGIQQMPTLPRDLLDMKKLERELDLMF